MRFLHAAARHRSCLPHLVLAACLNAAGTSQAQTTGPTAEALRLSGFGSIGVSHVVAPTGWGFQRESVQGPNAGGTRWDTDSRLGLQANYAFDPRFELVGQWLLTRRMASAPGSEAIAWAFAAFRPTESLSMRVGRVSVNLYQLSDYRSVGLAYPFVRPPTEFYSLLPGAIDGLDATHHWRGGGDAHWKLNGYYGQTRQADNRSNQFGRVRPLYGVFLSREDQGLLIKASISRARLASEVKALAPLISALQPLTGLPWAPVAEQAQALQRGLLPGQTFDYFGLGLNLDRDDWLLTMEASHAVSRGARSLDAGYALVGRRLGAITPYAIFSATRVRSESPAPQWEGALAPLLGPVVAAQAQALADAAWTVTTTGPNQRTWSVGIRWDTSARTAVKLQYDHSRIGTRGSLLWANGSDEAASAHVLSATLDFVF